ncbi:GGDEF domain-containing protein [Ruminococcus sp. OA3]|uniref:sensor domain-containing diguanylate cyclase n=1 Tax=Ruminococcus sp. OA3 TaxID=2914164 RepID=UPI001F0662C5|nr:GGDEF domain-containing protein [Ruminococcus sp. OA3]MCH1981935.1 GGDEF domain-containing protein [Ruminococcus sp. OA3]
MKSNRKTYPKQSNWHYYLFLPAGAVCFVILTILYFGSRLSIVEWNKSDIQTYDTGWSMENGSRLTLPAKASSHSGSEVTIVNTLPQVSDDTWLVFENSYQAVEVFIDGTRVFEYGMEQAPLFGHLLGNCPCRVALHSSDTEKTIKIHFINIYGNSGINISTMRLGTDEALIVSTLRQNLGLIICLGILVVMAAVLFLSSMISRFRERNPYYTLFLYLGLFTSSCAVWLLTDSSLPELFAGNVVFICLLSFYSFMLIPVFMLLFISELCHNRDSSGKILCCLMLLNMIVQSVFYVCDIADFPQMLIVTHLFLGISCIWLLCFLIRDLKNNHSYYAKIILCAITVLIAAALIEVLSFYFNYFKNSRRFFRGGLLIFIGTLIFLSWKKYMELLQENMKVQTYQKLAMTDSLTNIGSHAAYLDKLELLKQSPQHTGKVLLIMMDVNFLKETNDQHGHNAGDLLLKGAAKCIRQAFADSGSCFRVGGDEFIVILEEPGCSPENYSRKLDIALEEHNAGNPFPVSLARGYAYIDRSQGDITQNIQDAVRRADLDMYENKRKYHRT